MPQNRINILCTKDIDRAAIQEALSKGIVIDITSFIKTESSLTTQVLNEVHKVSKQSGAVIFTSVNAVESTVAIINRQKSNPGATNWKIFCIGHATKQSVIKYFGEGSIAAVADNGKELAKAILNANINEVIFFCGDQRRDELPELLRKNKVEVKEIIVYKTIATPQKIEKKYDGILFFSPSAVKSFFQKNKLDKDVILFAIGHTTANEIENFSKNKIVVSDVPDKKTLLDKVISYFEMNPIHH